MSVKKIYGSVLVFTMAVALATIVMDSILSPKYAVAAEKGAGIVVKGLWSRPTLGNLRNSAAFLSVLNHSKQADRLVGVTSTVAKRVELHTHLREGAVMKMRKIKAIDVPASGFVDLEPGGHHVMLIGLHKGLKAGDKFSLSLKFEKGGEKTVEVVVRPLGGATHADHHRGSNAGSPAKSMGDHRGSH